MSSGGRIGAVVAGVLKTPVSWALWGGALLVGTLVPDSYIPLVAGGALGAQGLIAAAALRDPEFLRRTLRTHRVDRARRLLQRAREDTAALDTPTRERIEAILGAYESVCREAGAKETPRYARAPLAATVAQMGPLAERAARLAVRRAELARCLETVNPSELRGQAASLRVRRERAADPVLASQLEQALRSKEEETASYEAMTLTRNRIDGQLEAVECAFAALKARVLRFKSEDRTEWQAVGDHLHAEVATLTAQMDALDGSVREVLALRGSAG